MSNGDTVTDRLKANTHGGGASMCCAAIQGKILTETGFGYKITLIAGELEEGIQRKRRKGPFPPECNTCINFTIGNSLRIRIILLIQRTVFDLRGGGNISQQRKGYISPIYPTAFRNKFTG